MTALVGLRLRGRLAALLAGAVLLLSVAPALATSGVSVDLGRIDIKEQLKPGGAYTLPSLGVRNPGTERTTYTMIASPVQDPTLAAPPPAWFTFEPSTVTLDPGEIGRVRIRLVLPTDAKPGDYIVLVGAQIATPGSGASVGAAAAARTTFTIQPANELQAFGNWLSRTFDDLQPWSTAVPAIVLLAAAVWLLRRRFAFRIGIERRPR